MDEPHPSKACRWSFCRCHIDRSPRSFTKETPYFYTWRINDGDVLRVILLEIWNMNASFESFRHISTDVVLDIENIFVETYFHNETRKPNLLLFCIIFNRVGLLPVIHCEVFKFQITKSVHLLFSFPLELKDSTLKEYTLDWILFEKHSLMFQKWRHTGSPHRCYCAGHGAAIPWYIVGRPFRPVGNSILSLHVWRSPGITLLT